MLKGNESLMAHKRLGDLLIDAGLITEDQLVSALKSQRESHRRLGDELIAKGVITETELIEALCQQLGIDYIDLTNVILPAELTQVVPKNLARKYDMVPVRATRDEVFIAMGDPMNFIAQEEARVPDDLPPHSNRARDHAALRQRGRSPRHRRDAQRAARLRL